ncbi:MAG: hypothetical protein KME58_07765 [Candidatus Thiodiazotropha sp. (ex Lucina pensylvanica)]|nr:hypothetical protein [Candidatus Thiodiazotropha sp. (ex Lucina pensylvanica)]
MRDKRSSDKSGITPKQPPKRPARDYSALPQRPITLKHSKKKKSASKTIKSSANKMPSSASKKKAPPKKAVPRVKKKPANRWLLKGISETTRQYAQEEANRQGVAIGEWIERLILSSQRSATGSQQVPDESQTDDQQEEIAEALHAIEQRLDKIEEQKGFWRQFWEQVKEQAKP